MIRRPPRSTPLYSSAASDVYKRQSRQCSQNSAQPVQRLTSFVRCISTLWAKESSQVLVYARGMEVSSDSSPENTINSFMLDVVPSSLSSDNTLAKKVTVLYLSLIHISEPTRLRRISYAVFCLKKKKKNKNRYRYN